MLRKKTPIGKLEEQPNVHPAQEKDPLPAHPGGVNPETGEVGGPRGPEPTRYGDWERKGRSDRLLTRCDIWAVLKNLRSWYWWRLYILFR